MSTTCKYKSFPKLLTLNQRHWIYFAEREYLLYQISMRLGLCRIPYQCRVGHSWLNKRQLLQYSKILMHLLLVLLLPWFCFDKNCRQSAGIQNSRFSSWPDAEEFYSTVLIVIILGWFVIPRVDIYTGNGMMTVFFILNSGVSQLTELIVRILQRVKLPISERSEDELKAGLNQFITESG